tara:strand:- start:283 stop:702 length:420 start_codon:yes stop_codon:yes gene_type:complete
MVISLKKAIQSDWNFILELRNSDFQYFYEQNEPISRENHSKYLENHTSKSNFYHWIILSDEKSVGYIRILNHDVGIMIQKEYQNKGFASIALALLEKEAKNLRIKKLIALIHPKNIGSEKIFKNNGYNLKLLQLEKVIK